MKVEISLKLHLPFHEVDVVDSCMNVWACVVFLLRMCLMLVSPDSVLICGCQFVSVSEMNLQLMETLFVWMWVCVCEFNGLLFPEISWFNPYFNIQTPGLPPYVRAGHSSPNAHTHLFLVVQYPVWHHSVWSRLGGLGPIPFSAAGIRVRNLKVGLVPFPAATSDFNRLTWIRAACPLSGPSNINTESSRKQAGVCIAWFEPWNFVCMCFCQSAAVCAAIRGGLEHDAEPCSLEFQEYRWVNFEMFYKQGKSLEMSEYVR